MKIEGIKLNGQITVTTDKLPQPLENDLQRISFNISKGCKSVKVEGAALFLFYL